MNQQYKALRKEKTHASLRGGEKERAEESAIFPIPDFESVFGDNRRLADLPCIFASNSDSTIRSSGGLSSNEQYIYNQILAFLQKKSKKHS
jgi:hypothetical protein